MFPPGTVAIKFHFSLFPMLDISIYNFDEYFYVLVNRTYTLFHVVGF